MFTVFDVNVYIPTINATLVKFKRKLFVYSTTFFEIGDIYCLRLFQQIKSLAITFCAANFTVAFVYNDKIASSPTLEIF